jgi:methylmalonyl-CoA mutase
MGGMTKAVASGLPKRMIEEAATRRQAAVDKGDEVIVGVNKYRLEQEDHLDILEIDNSAVRLSQIARIERTRRQRDPKRVAETIAALEQVARSGEGNILAAAVDASRARATVGEISDAMRRAFGDHAAVPEVVENVYGKAYDDEPEFQTLVSRLEQFAGSLGEKPRVMVAKLGQDGHDRGAKIIASAFGDIGFEVIAGPLFQTPGEAADTAIASRVHVVGMSSLAAGHKTLAPQLVQALKAKGAADIIVVVGGVIPRQDYQYLLDHGVSAVFGPGTNVLDAARAVLDLMEGKRRNQ